MYHMSAEDVDERMINVHYCYYTSYQLSPISSKRAIQKSLTLNKKGLRIFRKKSGTREKRESNDSPEISDGERHQTFPNSPFWDFLAKPVIHTLLMQTKM